MSRSTFNFLVRTKIPLKRPSLSYSSLTPIFCSGSSPTRRIVRLSTRRIVLPGIVLRCIVLRRVIPSPTCRIIEKRIAISRNKQNHYRLETSGGLITGMFRLTSVLVQGRAVGQKPGQSMA